MLLSGNMIIIAATTSCVIALTWSGIRFSWSSATVLAPLIIGLLGLAGFLAYETIFPKYPVVRTVHLFTDPNSLQNFQVPFALMSTRTGLSGFLQTFIMPIVLLALVCAFDMS